MIWKWLLWVARIIFWSSCALFLVAACSRFFARGNPIERPEGLIEFPPSPMGYFCFVMMAASLPLSLEGAFLHSRLTVFDCIMASYVVLIAIAICLSVPGTISVDPEEITQRFWLRKNRHIRWKDIVEVKTTIRGPIEIPSNKRTKVNHSSFLVGRERFLFEIKKHCGDELPADFPREPLAKSEP